MKNRRIVIASVLKPVDDTRMYEKMGATLAKQDGNEVFIFGQPISKIPAHAGIQFIALRTFDRLSISRLLVPIEMVFKLIKVKPKLLIVNTHELLIVSLLFRILFGCQIVYDIRENYYRNIRFSETYPPRLRLPISWWIRLKEKVTARLFNHIILAERSYATELGFIGKRFTILENKAVPHNGITRTPGSVHKLLFTGTVAQSTGVFEAITLATALHKVDTEIRLVIAGYCALPNTRKEIMNRIKDKRYIQLRGFHQLLPHNEVITEIEKADFGIMYYPPSPHTSGSVPTKLFEYMASRLPIITWANQPFSQRVIQHQAGVLWDVPEQLLMKMKSELFYPKPVEDVYWEGKKFTELIEMLLK